MTCIAFGSSVSVFVHPKVIDLVRISNSFKHFELKICFHSKSYHKTRHNTFVSRLLIPLDLIFFRSWFAFLWLRLKKVAGPSRSGYVPSGSGSGCKHHFVTPMDVSRGLWNSKKFRWAFLGCDPLDVLLVTWRPSCLMPILAQSHTLHAHLAAPSVLPDGPSVPPSKSVLS